MLTKIFLFFKKIKNMHKEVERSKLSFCFLNSCFFKKNKNMHREEEEEGQLVLITQIL